LIFNMRFPQERAVRFSLRHGITSRFSVAS
jgi:hypothetical protein